ncbi:MAG: thioredoxin-disulfide reductase [Geminicoccaceae bacterium]|nr:thioredoxin-disulfide reductase [Geminicoccaceae bacterium]
MEKSRHVKVLIIGSGPAGYTAAIYTARAGLDPLLVQGLQPGGQLSITNDVENYPGFAEAIQGPWLMEQMQGQAEACGAEVMFDLVSEVDLNATPLRARTDGGIEIMADSVIIATGAVARWLGLPSERAYQGHGVSACATCDGFFFRGKRVAVVGGGNTAAEEALYLANLCEHVTIVHRRDEFRAEKILQERVSKTENIDVVWNHVVDEVLGVDEPRSVTGLRLKHVQGGETSEIPVEGVFIAIGHSPATELFRGQLAMDREGYLITRPDSMATEVAGVFAAGDVQDRIYRQAVTAAGTGCMAALEAERYLSQHQDG